MPTVPWKHIGVYCLVAFALAWAFASPIWIVGPDKQIVYTTCAIAMMFAPTIAVLVVIFFLTKPARPWRALGLIPDSGVWRTIVFALLGLALPIIFSLAAVPVGAALGLFPADWTGFSGFQQLLDTQMREAGVTEDLGIPIGVFAALQIVNAIVASLSINLIPALGEEIGWRGWLLPRLLPLGPWTAIAVSGVIWGLWHAPVILQGHNYPDAPGWLGLLAMVGFTTIIGGILGWLRLQGGSVWPAAVGHAAINASASLFVIFTQADVHYNTLQVSLLGWTGWLLPAAVVAIIVVTGQFKPAADVPADS